MAEGLLDGVLVGEGEKADVDAPNASTVAEAFAAAVAAIASRQDSQVAQDTSAFLKKRGTADEIQQLAVQAAEYVYAKSQPLQ